jgi:hypothetical protein
MVFLLAGKIKNGLAWREDVCGKPTARSRNQASHKSARINRFAWALRPIPRYFVDANRVPQDGDGA